MRPLLFIARYINHRQPTLRISFRFALFSEAIMAIVPIMNPTAATPLNAEAAANVQAWTEQAAEALQSVSLSSQSPRGMSVRLSIPLDPKAPVASSKTPTQGQVHTSYGRRKLIRRDSLERREALLKGKEGSRQRRRWENGKPRRCTMI